MDEWVSMWPGANARIYLIVDWMMPEMDGLTFCDAVRRDPLLKSSQILLMTAHDTPAQIAEGLAARRRRLSE